MSPYKLAAATATFALVLGLSGVPADLAEATTPPAAAAQAGAQPRLLPTAVKFKNCTKLNKKYRHGVGKKGAKDRVSGRSKPVKNFTRNNAAYAVNRHLDRDRDGIACEKR
nr:excalibur calcium-binding domain-containing protein [Propionicimonas sp.]